MAKRIGTPTDERDFLHGLIDAGIAGADARRLTTESIKRIERVPSTIVAIGKAAPSMVWGAADALGSVSGLCVSSHPQSMPSGIELIIGDHPVPGAASFRAGARAMEVASSASDGILALISGGGSALCELPKAGIDEAAITAGYRTLVDAAIDIEDMNLVRGHLSAIKNGGLAAAASGPVTTLIVSDVWPHGPAVVASGPTIHRPIDLGRAESVLQTAGIVLDPGALAAWRRDTPPHENGRVEVLADARTAGRAIVDAAERHGKVAHLADRPIQGEIADELDWFLQGDYEVRVGAGEPIIAVTGQGRGGRNSHAALMAAMRIAGSGTYFVALATDGSDGRSDSAGAIVDGTTISRGLHAEAAIEAFESGTYLGAIGDLIAARPTGTNVADIWIAYRSR